MTPEGKARQRIDDRLEQAGWVVQDFRRLDLGAAPGVAIREYPTDTGPADYLLFVDREPVGVIEAKADASILTFVEEQTARYAGSALKWRVKAEPLPFLFESTGQITRFTDGRDPSPRSREIFHFFTPGQLVPQDPNDEPASALLARIRAEREARSNSSPNRRTRKTAHA